MPTALRPLTQPGKYIQGQLATFIITTIRASGEPTGFDHPQMRIVTTDGTNVSWANVIIPTIPDYLLMAQGII